VALDALPDPIYLLELRSTRIAALELLLLAVAGGILGAFVVLRRLAFYTHAVGTATFPGVVVAEAASFSPRVAALGVALAYAGGVERAGRPGRDPGAEATGLMLVLALAVGTILASDVFASGAGVDRLLFGSAVALSDADVVVAAAAAALAVAAALVFGRAWAAMAFDPGGAAGLGVPARWADLALLAIVGACAVAALPAVGALLVTSLFVVPAAIARLVTRSVAGLVAASVGAAAALGLLGLYGSIWLDVPPGPAIAVLGTAVYAVVAGGLAIGPARTGREVPA
jgi:manganese/iron transport system permease protein